MKIETWIKENSHSLTGKTVAITGSTGGLGKHICLYLAGLGANLILIDRNEKRSSEHKKELQKINDQINVKSIIIDMLNFDSVKRGCELLKNEKIDMIILNAGAYSLPREKTKEGYDNVFQINFVSPYFIVKEMLSVLRKREHSKIVVVGSIAHKYSTINENDVQFKSVKAPRKVYGNAKRFLMFSLIKLLEKETSVFISIAHPGITPTNITSHYPKFVSKVIKYPMKMIFTSPKKASLNIIKGIFENCESDSWIAPRVCGIWGYPKKVKLNTCSEEEQQKIFSIAENIYDKLKKKEKKHELGLQPEYYDLAKEGVKIYEGRLNDDKRKLIEIGDIIVFKKDPERKENFKAKVVNKYIFASFKEMAESLNVKDIGFEGMSPKEIASVYRQFYSEENESKYGVVAIEVEKIND